MTREKFIESITSSRYRLCIEETDYSLYERDGIYLFVFDTYVTDALTMPSFTLSFSDIALIRVRKGYFEIETVAGDSFFLTVEDDIEIGCMG